MALGRIPVDFIEKIVKKTLVPIKDVIRNTFESKFARGCKFKNEAGDNEGVQVQELRVSSLEFETSLPEQVVEKVNYVIDSIPVLKLAAFPPTEASKMVWSSACLGK